MISRWKQREHQPARPLSNRAIALGAVAVPGIGAAAFSVLWWRYGGVGPGVELNAIRTAGALMVAAGGAAALLLTARRQAHTERDTREQRITELYTHAVDQLGAEKAPVRLGGLHALERLAQNHPAQRQTIVDVICAYLRMPYTLPDDQSPDEGAPEEAHNRYEQRRQELQVRLTAQRILTAHLNLKAASTFWANIALNLAEAHLHQLNMSTCHIRSAYFDGATFTGGARFSGATFTEVAWFGGATFTEVAWFEGTTFTGVAGFGEATFTRDARFEGATFTGRVRFEGATFTGYARFDGARVASNAQRPDLPIGWTTRAAQAAEGKEDGWLYVVRDEESSEQDSRGIR